MGAGTLLSFISALVTAILRKALPYSYTLDSANSRPPGEFPALGAGYHGHNGMKGRPKK